MEKIQSPPSAGYCGGRRAILSILMAYTLLLGIICLKYLYHSQELTLKPNVLPMITRAPVHVQNTRNIVRLQTENRDFMFHNEEEFKNNLNNDTLLKNNSSLHILNNATDSLLVLPVFNSSLVSNVSQVELAVVSKSKPPIVTPKKPEPPVHKEPRPSVLYRYKSMRTSKPFQKHCKTCAIVSSSGQLLGKRLGSEIDSYPCVFRMNTAPVMGFEKDVGHKTTVRVSCFISTKGLLSTPSLFAGSGKPENVLMWGLYHKKNTWALRNANSLNSKYKDVEFFAQDMAGETYAGEVFKQETGQDRAGTNTWLSTGWFTMMVALDMCDDIHVYGMIPENFCAKNPGSRVKYHYYQYTQNPAECNYYKSQEGNSKGGHRFITEKAIFERWGRRYNMTFHNPVWDLKPESTERKIETPFMKKYAKKTR